MINFGIISNVIGVLLIIVGVMMLAPIGCTFIYDTPDKTPFILSSVITIAIGSLSWFYKFKNKERIGKRDGYLVVAGGWMAMCFFGSLPFIFSGQFNTPADAFFEAVSGLTATGATILDDIERMPEDILMWRSVLQWLGGMGMIVLAVAIFPLLGIGGVELFVNESPGPAGDKIHPRIREVAKRLWLIYVGMTIVVVILLKLAGMNAFDSINHAFTTMATGGYSTKNASIGHYNSPLIEYIIIVFMFLSGMNYTLIYFGLTGKVKKIIRSDEFRLYAFNIGFLTICLAAFLFFSNNYDSIEKAFRVSLFNLISIITTTGYATADYTSWSPFVTFLFLGLFFLGGCGGSTTGSIKQIRHLVFVKNALLEFKRILHPRAMIRVKVDNNIVASRTLINILLFILIFGTIFVFSTGFMSFILRDFETPLVTAAGAVASSLGNVGPGIGEVGPVNTYSAIPSVGKYFLSFLMLLGRLELFTLLIIFTPYFWRRN